MAAGRYLLVVGDDALAHRIDTGVSDATVIVSETTDEALALLDRGGVGVDCVVTDHDPPERDSFPLLDRVGDVRPVVVAVTDGSSTLASETLGAGAADYVAVGDPDAPATTDDAAADSDPLAKRVRTVLDERAPTNQTLERYKAIIEALGDPVYVLDDDARFTFVNRAVTEVLDYDPDELLGEHVGLVIDDDHEAAADTLITTLLDGDERRRGTVEGELVTSDGERIPVENHIVPLPTEDGAFRGTAGIVRDISDRKRRIEELEQYETIVETVPDGVFVVDENARIVGGNERGAEMIGYEKPDLIGTSIPELVDRGVFSESIIEAYTDLLPTLLSETPGQETGSFEFSVSPVDVDEERTFEARVALRPHDEEFVGSIGILRDVTERKHRLEELERYKTIVEAVPDTVYAVDEEGHITFVNESGINEFGYSADEIASGNVHFEATIADEDVEKMREATRELLSGATSRRKATVEYTAVTRDGRRYPAENHFAVMPSDEGVAGAGISRDISERKRRKRRLDVLNRVLRHNLRNDMAAVIGLAESIEVRSEESTVVDDASEIRTIAGNLVAMGDRIRELADAIDKGVEDAAIDAVAVVERAVERIREQYSDVTIETDLPAERPVVATSALEIAVVELLENAIEHNHNDRPRIAISLTESELDTAGWIDLTIVDDGPGIPEEERSVVTGEEITPLSHGSGLGLWTVVWIVESFHGDLDITDRDTVTVPTGEASADTATDSGTAVTLRLKRRED